MKRHSLRESARDSNAELLLIQNMQLQHSSHNYVHALTQSPHLQIEIQSMAS